MTRGFAFVIALALSYAEASAQDVRFATPEEIAADALLEARFLLAFRIALVLWIAGWVGAGLSIWRKRSRGVHEDCERARASLQRELRGGSGDLLEVVPGRFHSAGMPAAGWVALLQDRLLAIDSATGRTLSIKVAELADSRVVESSDCAISVILCGARSGELRLDIDHVDDGARFVDALRRMGLGLKYRRYA